VEAIILGAVLALLAVLGIKIRQGKAAEALLENEEDLKRYRELDDKRRRNKAMNEDEKRERKALRLRLKTELKEKGVSNEEISDFLSGRYDKLESDE